MVMVDVTESDAYSSENEEISKLAVEHIKLAIAEQNEPSGHS